MFAYFKRKQRRRIISRPFEDSWDRLLRENVWHYEQLEDSAIEGYRRSVQVLVGEKNWEGCGGQRITEEIKVTVAGFASLLILGFEDYYFDELHSILVYPGGFVVKDEDDSEPSLLLGVANPHGSVAVSWWDTEADELNAIRTAEVVLHEFAHLLDFSGKATPSNSGTAGREKWVSAMKEEYQAHVNRCRDGRAVVLQSYGAGNLDDFSAVAAEHFFLNAIRLRSELPRLYELLCERYRQDPAVTFGSESAAQPGGGKREMLQREEEIAELTKSIDAHPELTSLYRARADLHLDADDYESAIADLNVVLERTSEDDEARHNRGMIFCILGQYDRAIADLNESIRLNPRVADSYAWRAWCLSDKGEHARALADWNASIRRDPENPENYCGRALSFIALKEISRAIQDCEKTLALNPGEAFAHKNLGLATYVNNEHERSVSHCTEALRLDPELASAYRIRALAYGALGKDEEARRDRAKAERLDPGAREDPVWLPTGEPPNPS